jgi:hypothetical protein
MAGVGEERREHTIGAQTERRTNDVQRLQRYLRRPQGPRYISPEAVRMRIKRGTLPSEKRAGRVYVLLGPRPTNEQTTEQTPDHTEELIATLREQLQAERQAHAEARRLLAAALERIPPQLEPPAEPPGAPETGGISPKWVIFAVTWSSLAVANCFRES